ncbi:hypothetical protein BYT27DRAFT_6682295 [Phlegmacium glaucopus]|nr:hypothetical protein BYT27DRAFT_6682295 [Phlegmacium glaucopus]
MDNIDGPPVIAYTANSFDFSNHLPLDSSPFYPPLSIASPFNTINNYGTPDAQAYSTGTQSLQTSNQLTCATPFPAHLPVRGMPATSATSSIIPTSPQTDENRRIAPLPLRSAASISSTGFQPQEVQDSGATPLPLRSINSTSPIIASTTLKTRETGNMPPPPLPDTRIRGKKRKSIAADEAATPSEAKKRKSRPLSEKQKGKQKALDLPSDNQVPCVAPGLDSGNNNQHNNVSSFPNHMLPDHTTAVPPCTLEGTVQPNEPHFTQRPPIGCVKDSQHLHHLVSTCSLPGIVRVSINEQHPARISQMIITVRDPESQGISKAYFVPYVWFPEDLKRPHKIHKNDRLLWGHRIYEYQHRVQCGRIALTITGSLVLFFASEQNTLVDSFNYHSLLKSNRPKTQAQVTQSLPGSALVAASTSSQGDALPTQELFSNIQNNDCDDTSTLTEATFAHQCQQSFVLSSGVLLNNNNNEADINASTSFDLTYNIPSIVQQGTSTDISQSFPVPSDNIFHEFQFNDYNTGASNVNTDTSSDFTSNINDTNNEYGPDTNTPFNLSDFNYNYNSHNTTTGPTFVPGPSPFDQEDMHQYFKWPLQDASHRLPINN